MSSQNSEVQGTAFAIAIIIAVFWFIFLFVFALATFLAFIFTVLAILAWDKPLKLMGQTLYPHEARAFVLRGIAGTFLLPAFAWFASVFLGFQIEPKIWPYLFIGGYVAGSIGVEWLNADAENNAAPAPPPFPAPPPAAPSPPARPALPRPPFEYASWDDEERRP